MQNLHTHTHFSDGSAPPGDYVNAAREQGLSSIGFSDHSPLPFANSFALRDEKVGEYCETVIQLKKTHHDPEVLLGMEADYIPGMGHSFQWFRDQYPLDYLIGSVHLVRNGTQEDLWFIDGPDPATYDEGLARLFDGDIRRGVTAYYRQVNEMLSAGSLDVIGHLDKIKMHNRNRLFREDERWYMDLVDETLDLVKQTGVIAEVNTRGIYKKRSETLFPGPGILERMRKLDIPVMIASDAHRPEEVALLFAATTSALLDLGFRETACLTATGWTTNPLHHVHH